MDEERELIDGEPYTFINGKLTTLAELVTGSKYYEYINGNPLDNQKHNIRVLSREQWEEKRRARGNN